MEARLRDGQHDSQALVQAFAHHAQQARLEERELAAQVVEADPIAAGHVRKRIAASIRERADG